MYATGYQVEAWEECLQSEGKFKSRPKQRNPLMVQVEMCKRGGSSMVYTEISAGNRQLESAAHIKQ